MINRSTCGNISIYKMIGMLQELLFANVLCVAWFRAMIRENRQLVTDEPVEFEI
jgi:hypothetical protein